MKNKSKFLWMIGVVLILILTLIILRNPILKSMANFLIVEDEIEFVEYAFVLSGQALERGTKAANLLNAKKISKAICTGANQPPDLTVFNADLLESDLTQLQILKTFSDTSKVQLLQIGTSTFEEAEAILAFCHENDISEILIITSKFHTRRAKSIFKKQFKNQNISIYFSGANSMVYNESEWWKSEYGLIALNNEYLKLFYYFFRY